MKKNILLKYLTSEGVSTEEIGRERRLSLEGRLIMLEIFNKKNLVVL